MIAEQNAAYQQSLQADREKLKRKEEQKRMEEEERQEKEAREKYPPNSIIILTSIIIMQLCMHKPCTNMDFNSHFFTLPKCQYNRFDSRASILSGNSTEYGECCA